MNLHKSQVLFYGFLGFLVGTALASALDMRLQLISAIALAIFGIMLGTVFLGQKFMCAAGLFLVLSSLGIWRAHSAAILPADSIIDRNDQGLTVWQGVVIEEPDVREDRINLTIEARQLVFPQARPVSGRVSLTASRYPEYRYGDRLLIEGKLETPFETEEFSYKDYLAKNRIYSTERYAKIEKLAASEGNPVVAWLLGLKAAFVEQLSPLLTEPQNSLLAGLLVGAKRGLGEEWVERFKIAGVSHIIAISGFNIAIITRILGDFFRRHLGLKPALFLCFFIVLGFVILTGAQASVVRAAIMGMLVVVALHLGRVSAGLNLLTLTAAIMVAFSPPILVFDVGFQLSFLATLGLITLSPHLEKVFRFVPQALELRVSLCATLAAQICVLPLLVYHFDQLSLVAPFSNLFILPVIPWAMFFGFVSGVAGFVWLNLAYLPIWITWLILSYILKIIEWSAAVPFASLTVKHLPASWVFVYYLLLGISLFWLWARERERRLNEFCGRVRGDYE